MTRHPVTILFSLALVLSAISCRDNFRDGAQQQVSSYKVAVIFPSSSENPERWKETAELAGNIFSDAQSTLKRRIELDIEWYDENSVDLESLGKSLASREDIMCVVGPEFSDNLNIMASQLEESGKVLFSPGATSAEIMRRYAGKDFFWSIVESDITQCEVLLSQAFTYGYKEVSLIASESLYGSTFIDWFSYQATEMGLTVRDLYTYNDDPDNANLKYAVERAFKEAGDNPDYCIIAAPTDSQGAYVVMKEHARAENPPHILYSDVAIAGDYASLGEAAELCEGISPSSDPESGFDIIFRTMIEDYSPNIEAQVFDSFVLALQALTAMESGLAENMNEALKLVVATKNEDGSKKPGITCCLPDNLVHVLRELQNGRFAYDIAGASGTLDFDERLHTTVTHSIYMHWIIYNGHVLPIDYMSTGGESRNAPFLAAWEWKTTVEPYEPSIKYPSYKEREDNWALIVAASEGWDNYRHQADALSIYQEFKYAGYDDDHIVLVMDDDIAYHEFNPEPGHIKRFDGLELYENVVVDYHTCDLKPDDFIDILVGKERSGLPQVISGTDRSNIFVFWSGHGAPGAMNLENRPLEECFTEECMERLLQEASSRNCYRKMLWFIETCYSGSVAIAAEELGTPGVLMFTAASAMETSKADVRENGVWMTNRFTKTLIETLYAKPEISFRELYLELNKQTLGSHVCVFNKDNFDNLVRTNLTEFIYPD